MKIGFDAKWFFEGPPSNTEVTRNLVEQLVALNDCHELYLFLDQRHRAEPFPFSGPHVHPLYVWADVNLLSNLLLVPHLARKLNLDVVLFQNFAPPLSRFKRIAFIHDVIFASNPEYFTLNERIYFWPMKFLARRAHKVLTISESEKNRIVSHKFSEPPKVHVIHHGVSSRFQPRERHPNDALQRVKLKYQLPDEFLLYVGRLNQRKNLLNLLKSLTVCSNTTIPLIIVGREDWKMFDIRRTIEELRLEGRVRLIGFVGSEDLPILYSLSTVFCYLSFEEGFGLPPLEAMASGVPVVAANTASLPEVCGDAGTYVDPHDPQAIAAAIDQLLNVRDLYLRKREEGIRRAGQFIWKNSAQKLLQEIICVAER